MSKELWEELQAKIDFLKQSTAWDEGVRQVESIETHMSWIFLTNDHAFKLKKPNSFAHLNLESLSARLLNAQREVALNQHLAPGYYLGLVPLSWSKDHGFKLGLAGEGFEIVDWLVKMRRYPQQLTLDQLIWRQQVNMAELTALAQRLARFYAQSLRVPLSPWAYYQRLKNYVEQNRQSLLSPHYGLDRWQLEQIHNGQSQLLEQHRDEFYARAQQGRIIEAHGDLRPEHICLTHPPIIVDRLEFSQELRSLDPIDELSYLNIECQYLGNAQVGKVFFESYKKISSDNIPEVLLQFYQSYRCALRAKISLWHLDDPRVLDHEKWLQKGKKYLNLAWKFLALPWDSVA